MMIRCNLCGIEDYHYTEDRNTIIGCYLFKNFLAHRYICDDCIVTYIDNLKEEGISRQWWPIEIRR